MSLLLVFVAALSTDPLLIPDTPATKAARDARFAGGCVSPDGAVVVIPEPGLHFGGHSLFLSAETGETVRTASGTPAGCLPEGALFVGGADFSVEAYTEAKTVRSGTVQLPEVKGECGAVSAELWPRETGFAYTLSLSPSSWRNGMQPGRDWTERVRCCLTGTVVVADDATFELHHSASGRSVECAQAGHGVGRTGEARFDSNLGNLMDRTTLPGGDHLEYWMGSGLVVRRVSAGGVQRWRRTFRQQPPPP